MEIRDIVIGLADILTQQKASGVLIYYTGERTYLFDYMIIAGVNSHIHAKTLIEKSIEYCKEKNIQPINPMPGTDSLWMLIDFGDFVLHLFTEEGMEFYRLADLWSDCSVVYEKDK